MLPATAKAACIVGAALLFSSANAREEKAAARSPVTKEPHLSVIRQAPEFPLRSESRGKPVLLAFIYTGCTTACPLLTWRMSRLQQKLIAARVPAVLVSVSVDPERDDAKALAAFAKRYDAKPGWHFVPGEAAVLAAYEEWTQRLPDGELDHPARVHLIDAQGRVREIYSLAFFDEEQAFYDIKALAK